MNTLWHNAVVVIVLVIVDDLSKWLSSCRDAIDGENAAIKALLACLGCCDHAFTAVGAIMGAMRTSFDGCRDRCRSKPTAESHDVEASLEEDTSGGREFVVVEFNAWECAGLEVLWAVVTTKIFDAVGVERFSRYIYQHGVFHKQS